MTELVGALWLVAGLGLLAALNRRCADAWRRAFALESGWRVERRVASDSCIERVTSANPSG